ncbi:MAG TPA: stimulus-sensing domain-containing protein [Beijerinckiaceae bacterium]|nr:stimulus-sensing domain-containing protein [Beijerinckiaceae bacterium]
MRRRWIRRLWQPIWKPLTSTVARRIVLLNLGGLAALLVGFLWLNQTRESVIDARVQSLTTQAEIIAAAVAASATAETDTITIDPDRLLELQAGETAAPKDEAQAALEFSINPEKVAGVLRRLVGQTRTRARLFDRDGVLLLDTRSFYSAGQILKMDLPPADEEETTLFERSWSAIKRRLGRMDVPTYEETPSGKSYQEVQRALGGVQASVVRVTTSGQTIVSVAVPVKRFRSVQGVLMVMTQEGDIDRVIADERLGILLVFMIAAGVMLILSLLMAGAIAEPLRRLAGAADRVRRRTEARPEIPDFSERSDEIGELSGALRDMTQALYSRIEAIESFAADVAHELKNPLTSLRSAVETLPLARTEEARGRLMAVIQHDVRRLDRLITDISSASRLDAELQRSAAERIDLVRLLETVIGMANDAGRPDGVVIRFLSPPQGEATQFRILGHDSRLVQVFNNLIDNARSFSKAGGEVRVRLKRVDNQIVVQVDDDGPGVPDHARDRIFERFYTDRPAQGFGQNSGLGLSISRQIVGAHRGTIHAENRKDAEGRVLGASFVVSLPAEAP